MTWIRRKDGREAPEAPSRQQSQSEAACGERDPRRRIPGTRLRRVPSVLAATAALTLFVGCGGGGGGGGDTPAIAPAANIGFLSASVSGQGVSGQTVKVSIELFADAPKYNVAVSADLVPAAIDGTIRGIDPAAPGFDDQAIGLGGTVLDSCSGLLATTFCVELPNDLPSGSYGVVLHINREDVTPEDDALQRETEEQMADNVIVVPVVVDVTKPTLPNLLIKSCGASAEVIDPQQDARVPAEPLPGQAIPVGVRVEVAAQSIDVAAGVPLIVQAYDPVAGDWLTLPVVMSGLVPSSPDWSPEFAYELPAFKVVEDQSDDPVTDANRADPCAGVTLDALLPESLFAGLVAAPVGEDYGADAVIRMRAVVDREFALDEWGETPGVLQEDNVCEFEIVILGSEAVPPAPKPAGTTSRAPADPSLASSASPLDSLPMSQILWSESTPRHYQSGPYLGAFTAWNGTRIVKSDTYGNKDCGISWALKGNLTWRNEAGEKSDTLLPVKALVTSQGITSIMLRGNTIELVDVRGGARVDACQPIFDYGAGIEVLGQKVYTKYNSYTIESATEGFTWTGADWSDDVSKSGVTWLGPIPVTVEVGGEGSINFVASLTFSSSPNGPQAHLSVGPHIAFSAFANATVDVGVASGGVGGELELLALDVTVEGLAQVPICNGGIINGSLHPSVTLGIPYALSSMSGNIYTWVRYFDPNPFHLGWTKKTWTIVKWNGLETEGSFYTWSKSW